MKKAYIRVSTESQKEIRQKKILVDSLGAEIIYTEKVSAKNKDREELKRMIEELQENDEIIVLEISRLARSLIDLHGIVQEIMDKGASIHFIKENMTFTPYETVDPMTVLLFNILGAFAQFEREITVQRTKEGVAIAKSLGKYKGKTMQICKGGKDEIRYYAIAESLKNMESITTIRKKYKVGMKTIYRIKEEFNIN